jgi:hypothetical protein
MGDTHVGLSVSERWACPRCGSPGYVVADILRCGNEGCPNTHEYDPATGERQWTDADYDRADGHA